MAYTLDEFLKLNKGFTKNWDQATNTAGVTNTNTGQSINFAAGQGSDYGLGGLENQSHIITDLNKFNTSIGNIPEVKPVESVSVEPVNAYESPYSTDITNTLASITNRPAFSYDAASDQGLQAAQESAMSAVSREAARRGMIYSDSNKSQLGKSSMALIPQFQETAYNQYDQQGRDLYSQLDALSTLEGQNYNKYIDQTNIDNAAAEKVRNDYINTLSRFSTQPGGYRAESDRLANDGDPTNDWKIPFVEAARTGKVETQNLDPITGQPLSQGIVSTEAREALNAYNAGFRTPEVMNILTNAGYQFPVTGGNGGASGGVDSEVPGYGYTASQYNSYKNQRNTLFSQYANNPQGLIDSIAGNRALHTNTLGEVLYDQLVSDAYAFIDSNANTPAPVETPAPDYSTKPYTDFITVSGMLEMEPTAKMNAFRNYFSILASQGVPESVIDSLAVSYGITPASSKDVIQ